MKIQKIALSILAIAISSSAFASSYPEQIQKHKEEIQAKLNSSSYYAVTENAVQNVYDGLKGSSNSSDPKNERTLVLIKSNSNTAYSYKVYSEQESKAVQDLSDKLSSIGLSEEVIYQTIKAQLIEDRKDSVYVAQLNNMANIAREGFLGSSSLATSEVKKFQDAKSSLSAAQAASIKNIVEGNLNNYGGEKVWGYKAKVDNYGAISEISKRGLVGSLSFAPSEIQKFKDADSSLQAQYADSAKAIIENNLRSDVKEINQQIYSSSQLFAYSKALHDRKGWASVISYLYGQEINKNITSKQFNQVVASLQEYERAKEVLDFNSLPADAPLSKVSEQKLNEDGLYESFVKHLWGVSDSQMLKQLQNVRNIGEGAIELAAEYKEKENARSIAEFNVLQEIALKEPDLAVKSLIKQAADLKLASYAK